MMPFSSSGNMNRSNYGTSGGFGNHGFGPSVFNQNVVKPIRGGAG